MPAPCGGCPCSCNDCIFDRRSAGTAPEAKTVVSKDDYGCVRPDGGAVVLHGGVLGMMRGEFFHPVTGRGAEFLHQTHNPLSAHC